MEMEIIVEVPRYERMVYYGETLYKKGQGYGANMRLAICLYQMEFSRMLIHAVLRMQETTFVHQEPH